MARLTMTTFQKRFIDLDQKITVEQKMFFLASQWCLNHQINESFFIQAHIFKTLNAVILKHKRGVN